MKAYTVVWNPSAEDRLAELWLDNPAIGGEITAAVNEIDTLLAHTPHMLGSFARANSKTRLVARPPIALLFVISEDDRKVEVTEVMLWDD